MHHGALVRLTINLKEDIYRVAKSVAISEDCSISAAVNKLLERAIAGHPARKQRVRNNFPVVKGSRPFTSAEVYSIDQL